MTKRKNKPVAGNSGSTRHVVFFRWKRAKEFTVLEDFVVQTLERKGALPDSEIADMLCLEAGDVAHIVGDLEKEYPGDVQGDGSRRSLRNGFSRDLPDGIAASVGGKMEEMDDNAGEAASFLDNFPVSADKLQQDKFRKEKNAKVYSLKISFNYGDKKNPDFRCGDVCLPDEIHGIMQRLLFPRQSKSGK